ncbi:MAG: gamma-glutamyltransferase [Oceanipulchritudo sp.]
MKIRFFLLLALFMSAELGAQPNAILRPVEARNAMVVAEEQRAAEAGLAVLRDGGNAVDAAVTVGFTLAVTMPNAGNIGGGGFMLIHDHAKLQNHALDYRETAPAAATRNMFLDETGEADPGLSRDSPLSVGVPGTVAGLLAAHERFGTVPLPELMAPAIRLAREGFAMDADLRAILQKAGGEGRLDEATRGVFFKENGEPHAVGEKLVQEDLARSLERIAESGRAGFYDGKTARSIVETLAENGGRMTLEDLAGYQPVWREPVSGTYREYTIHSMPPPSSGGLHLIQMLRLAENFPLKVWGQNSGQGTHILIEIMKRAYADRSQYLGDPDFHDVPVEEILSETYEQRILPRINSMNPTASADILPGELPNVDRSGEAPYAVEIEAPRIPPRESPETTHFSIVDAAGNAVANTYTLNLNFGSGIMAKGTGILLNNEMDDFSAKPGTPNAYGLIGGQANAVEPRKRMLSSMTPTIVLRDDEVHIVTGSPGGSRIITTVLQILLNIMEFDMNAAEATCAPRFHHQWLPDTLWLERGFPSDAFHSLRHLGYRIKTGETLGSAQTILRENETLTGATDPRRPRGAATGY